MKSIKLTYLLIGALAMTMAATGCKHKPVGVTGIPPYPRTGPNPEGPGPLSGAGTISTNELGSTALPDLGDLSQFDQDRAALAVDTVHFDLDSAVVKSSEKPKAEAVASYMKSAAAGIALLIEGHCDERGTEEYNRSLGERRALALREVLIQMGVDPSRVTTRSFGEDRPVDTGHDEAAWAKNRRGEFVVLHPKK